MKRRCEKARPTLPEPRPDPFSLGKALEDEKQYEPSFVQFGRRMRRSVHFYATMWSSEPSGPAKQTGIYA